MWMGGGYRRLRNNFKNDDKGFFWNFEGHQYQTSTTTNGKWMIHYEEGEGIEYWDTIWYRRLKLKCLWRFF